MATYLFTYHGGAMPETEEEGAKLMEAWTSWLGGLGDQVLDPGAPLGVVKTLDPNGTVTDGGVANGYSLISADSVDDALAIAKGCPHLGSGGSIQVGETVQM